MLPTPSIDSTTEEEKIIYLDNAASTPVRSEVLEKMLPYFSRDFGNPSSLYSLAETGRNAVAEAREHISKEIGSRASEIVFTSGGTEANNTAVKGVALALKNFGKHVIVGATEHHSVLHPAEQLERMGWEVTVIPVNRQGQIDSLQVAQAVRSDTTIVSIMLANNEIGTIQDIAVISEAVKRSANDKKATVSIHSDAVQAVGKLPIDVSTLGVDMLSFSGHKVGGPKGVGALYIKRGTPLEPLLQGGGQERQRRSGTENVPGIVGMGEAFRLAQSERLQFCENTKRLSEKLRKGILSSIDRVEVNSDMNGLPNIQNFSFFGLAGEHVLVSLDLEGVCASSGSACSSASVEPSHVLLALGMDAEEAVSSVRFSLGRDTTEEDVSRVIAVLPGIVKKLRSMPSMVACS